MSSIVLIGDSHTQVLWPIVTRAVGGAGHSVVFSEAHPGWSEETYRQKMPDLLSRLAAARPEIVVFELGGNGGKTGAAYAEDVRWLVQASRDAGARRIIWYGPASTAPQASASVAARHQQIANEQSSLLPSLGVEWHDSRPLTLTDQRDDGVHFNSTGYARWADDITRSILSSAPVSGSLWLLLGVSALVIAGAIVYRVRRDG